MITKIKENNNLAYGLCQFIIDSDDEVSLLPTDVRIHSIALSVNGNYYILTGHREWVPFGGNN